MTTQFGWEEDRSGDEWRAKKAAGRDKRAANRDRSAEALRGEGIAFESKNGGAHLIVRHEGQVINFWPGTGLWVVQGHPAHHRGVFRLIKHIKRTEKQP